MKRNILLISVFFFVVLFVKAQSTATDFNINSCNGSNHHLFAELDAGKIVVISFVEPCPSCIAPSLTAYGAVQGFVTTNPGRVVFYISDDLANTSCADLQAWITNSCHISNIECLSNAALTENSYGTYGMPKIIVAGGGTAHTLFLNQNNTLSVSAIQSAITSALAATGVNETNKSNLHSIAFPNPVDESLTFSYSTNISCDVNIDLYDMLGRKMRNLFFQRQSSGKHELQIDLENTSNGIYFIKINAGDASEIKKINVSH